MLYLLFAFLAFVLAFYFKEKEHKFDYILLGFAITFIFLEYTAFANADLYSKLLYTKKTDCIYTYITNTTLINSTECLESYDLNYNRTVVDFEVNNFLFVKIFDNVLFEYSSLIFWAALILFVLYVASKGLKLLDYL